MLNSQYENRYIFVLLVTEYYVYSTVIPSSLQSHSESVYPQTRLNEAIISQFETQVLMNQWRAELLFSVTTGHPTSGYKRFLIFPIGPANDQDAGPEPRLFPGLPEYSFLKPVLIPVTIQQQWLYIFSIIYAWLNYLTLKALFICKLKSHNFYRSKNSHHL